MGRDFFNTLRWILKIYLIERQHTPRSLTFLIVKENHYSWSHCWTIGLHFNPFTKTFYELVLELNIDP